LNIENQIQNKTTKKMKKIKQESLQISKLFIYELLVIGTLKKLHFQFFDF
jgi:hypothetical protein